jgi:hypothetical protein
MMNLALIVWVEVILGMTMKRRESGIRRMMICMPRIFYGAFVLGRR